MKIIEQPIKLAAIFSPDGSIVPTGFIYAGRRYKVTLIQQTWQTDSWEYGDVMNFRMQVIGPDKQERICEVAFLRNKMR